MSDIAEALKHAAKCSDLAYVADFCLTGAEEIERLHARLKANQRTPTDE